MAKLDLKYRPKNFFDVLGNEGIKKILLTRSRSNTLGDQSMMFGGPKGCGKTSLARIVARAIFCTSLQDGEPCNQCDMCVSIINETCDSVEEMDSASQGTVDKIRSMIHDIDYETLDNTTNKVYILDEAQRLSKAAQDALLKTIENRDFVVILCTTEPDNIKGPIRNRVEEYPIYPPTEEDLRSRLNSICEKENINYEPDAISIIMKMNNNTPRSCILSLNTISLFGSIDTNNVKDYFRFNDYSVINDILRTVDSNPHNALSTLEVLATKESPTWIRNSIVLAISSGLRQALNMKHGYPVSIDFFNIRGRGWMETSLKLSSIDKPTLSDIESILLSRSSSINFIPVSQPSPVVETVLCSDTVQNVTETKEVTTPTPTPESPPVHKETISSKPDTSVNKEIEVDGVKFSTNENLTKFDESLKNDDNNLEEVKNEVVSVTLNGEQKPISEKEFFSEFERHFSRL